MINDSMIRGILLSTSINFSNRVKHHHYKDNLMGANLVTLFLDTILMDNCSEVIREMFVEAINEQMNKVK